MHVHQRLSQWNSNGQVYAILGLLTVVIAWFVLPLAGLLSVWCGYQLYTRHESTILSIFIAIFGAMAVLSWLVWVAGVFDP